jgi:hypothetical protein
MSYFFIIFVIGRKKEKSYDTMILERTNNEILIRLPSNIDLTELQSMLDYLRYKELTANSKAKQEDANKLSDEVNQSIKAKIEKQRRL